LKRPQPADPVDQVTGLISVPHDAIERLSYLVQVRRPMIQIVPSGLSVSDYRRNALRRFSNIVWRGAQMSSVDHDVLLWSGTQDREGLPEAEHPTNDLATLGGI